MDTSDSPKVSIGLPVYNGERFLSAALDSLLAQTHTDFEVVICDNASTDATGEICRDYAARDSRIRYHRNDRNLGAARNFNLSFGRARGQYFKWFAHDDVLAPTYLERCVETLDSAPASVVLCFPRRRIMTPDGQLLERDPFLVTTGFERGENFDDISFARLLRVDASRFPIFAFGLMRSVAMRKTRLIGSFIASDLVFTAEMRLAGRFREIPEPLFHQRLHEATAEVLARTSRQGDAAWFDPDNVNRRVMPETKLVVEYVRAIRRCELGPMSKLGCYLAIGGHLAVRAHRGVVRLPRRARRALWSAWTSLSREAVRLAGVNTVPLRLWMLLAGIRRRDRERIRAAIAPERKGTRAVLLRFAAERLAVRNDPLGHQMLADWLLHGDRVRRRAAADALGRWPRRFGLLVRKALGSRKSAPTVDELVVELGRGGTADYAKVWAEVLRNGDGSRSSVPMESSRSFTAETARS